jgi:hypothetical protein
MSDSKSEAYSQLCGDNVNRDDGRGDGSSGTYEAG